MEDVPFHRPPPERGGNPQRRQALIRAVVRALYRPPNSHVQPKENSSRYVYSGHVARYGFRMRARTFGPSSSPYRAPFLRAVPLLSSHPRSRRVLCKRVETPSPVTRIHVAPSPPFGVTSFLLRVLWSWSNVPSYLDSFLLRNSPLVHGRTSPWRL